MTAPARLIAALRDGRVPEGEALSGFVRGLVDGSVTDAQAGAFAMAVCLKGLGRAGRVALTEAMRDSGRVMDWALPGPVVDKHSTGGIGDAVSLLLAPALAACGAYVPMISGRGLGHAGGTLDKLEAIPGFRTQFDPAEFRQLVSAQGAAIVAASVDVAPADRRLYAIRDVTGTVESIDLITASILSKKLAAGLDALVLDVKVGSGAFFAGMEDARALARALCDTANGAGCKTAALITEMSQPLIPAAGNALEVAAVMENFADPKAHPALTEVTVALGGEALALAGLAVDANAGGAMIQGVLADGRAGERWGEMVAAQGGPSDFLSNWRDQLPVARLVRPFVAREAGIVAAIDGRALGYAVIGLGGGRRIETDRIDPAVGLSAIARIGDSVAVGDPICLIHAADEAGLAAAEAELAGAFTLAETAVAPPLVHERIA
ncbi:thymidine phosphorylase [Pararhodobacter sp. SW119]|uniref:thymidine phosphorylase n=1 Tax=Pararhodobacter sp. SW119 TaxID=2780075 RepID=UPI001ADEC3FE|nr:thymidine phosphorylase [Pararhodobacter sp. SW119]